MDTGTSTATNLEESISSIDSTLSDTMVIDDTWYIAENQETTIRNQSLILNGNIIINSTGKLLLYNVTLLFNNTISKSFDILVRDNGTMVVEESNIRSSPIAACSKIIFNEDSTGSIKDSNIQSMGSALGDFSGIVLKSDDVLLTNCFIQNSTYGMFLNGSSPTIDEVRIENCKFGIYGFNTLRIITNCTIANCDTSIWLEDNSHLTSIDSAFENPTLDNTSKLLIKYILDLQIIFNKPFIKPIKHADILVVNKGKTLYSTEKFGGNSSCTNANGRINPMQVAQKLYSGKNLIDYTTVISVNYKTRAKCNKLINITPCQSEIISFENNPPVLSYPNVNPWSGNVEDVFSYSINYLDKDNDPPGKVNVEIDDNIFQMVNKDDNYDWRNGTWFEYNTTQEFGEHKFRFIINDDLSFPDIYIPEGKTKYFSGPTVELKNSDPVLSFGTVSPKTGNTNTEFRYKIKYYDAENDPPTIAKVYIDNLPHSMTPFTSEDPEENNDTDDGQDLGTWYEFVTRLTISQHSFFFKFKDNNGSSVICWPEEDQKDNVIIGPLVNDFENKSPQLGNGSVSPKYGHRLIRFSYTISYYDPEGDIPTIAIVVIDGEPFDLTRARIAQDIYFYETFLPLGEHFFHFEFWDAENEHFVRFPTEEYVEIVGPIVFDLPPVLEVDDVTPDVGTPETLFKFSLKYDDPENDWPEIAKLIINNRSFNLSIKENPNDNLDSENVADDGNQGLLLSYSTQLPSGEYSYYFVIHSGIYILRYPASDYFNGPTVLITTDIPIDPRPDDNLNDTENTSTDQNTTQEPPQPLPNVNDTSNDLDISDILAEFEVLDYGIRELMGPDGIEYMFFANCEVPGELLDDCLCWVYINGDSYLMNVKKNLENNVTRVILSIKLVPGEHSYHFLFKLGPDMVRYPYLGEFRGPVVLEDGTQESPERGSQNPVLDNIQIIAILILLLSFLIFSIYYTYFAPKKHLR